MASTLESYVGHTVAVVTQDGRMIVIFISADNNEEDPSLWIESFVIGLLKGFDQTINLILDESHERVFSSTSGVEQVVLGLYIIRGDNIAVIGEIDDDTDSSLDMANIRADPLNPVVY